MPASPACPESAIFTDFKAPPDMTQFVEDNQRFFIEPLDGRDEPIGSPGGSGKVGPRRRRHRTRAVLGRGLGPALGRCVIDRAGGLAGGLETRRCGDLDVDRWSEV